MKQLFEVVVNIDSINEGLLYLYQESNLLPRESREFIKGKMREEYRWDDFDTVVDRLNAPELLDYYINQNFTKITSLESKSRSVRGVFTSKEGFCVELAMFGINALRRAGYDAAMYWDMKSLIKSYMPSWVLSGHVVATYKEGERMCIFVDFTTGGNIAHECMDVKLFKQNYVLRTQPLW